ncbi:hypothetical protein [Segniliparus rugosus]|uniref:Uncharacterized protein n=1 Tax=Segniliparus rugosus (strain ATCC BAA-974 / DSM 45345 / CCUG 50838 / CIP 108380 / JCM 13579 / CDC 945) TaxID=679197 RepID=E5XPC4_SEGRC|nr:hypothetical protein [Segniliparus rugosus]EFV13800.1 hypothetical protein HMPREF9336_01346 [Segniliparus rugosus ATCC BAA-974]
MHRFALGSLAAVGLALVPQASALADESSGVTSPSGKISCRVFSESVTCYAPFSSGSSLMVYQLGSGSVSWHPTGQPADGQTLSYGSPVAVNGWQVEAEESGVTFKKDGKGVFVSVQDVHAL